jgi:hypothetical protein
VGSSPTPGASSTSGDGVASDGDVETMGKSEANPDGGEASVVSASAVMRMHFRISVSAQVMHHLWSTCARLAIRHEDEAWAAGASGQLLDNPAEGITSEFEASLEGLTAAA